MLKKYLEKISKVEVNLVKGMKIEGEKIINQAIFEEDFLGDVKKYKIIFANRLLSKKTFLLEIIEKINLDNVLSKNEKDLLINEINIKLERIKFLNETYDIEANKVDVNYKYEKKNINYDKYNKIFFGVDNSFLNEKLEIKECLGSDTKISKEKLLELIEYSNIIISDIKFNFGDFSIFAHSSGTLQIPEKKEYTLQNIITLFFHETTHFFRGYNGLQNLGFRYEFGGYPSLEEGIAIYNEYFYGNQITTYGIFNPYYDICYKILTEDISEEKKQEKIYNVLRCKGFSQKKSLSYYYRFYKYSEFGSKNFSLKDLIYNSGLKNVKKLLTENKKNYEKIMAGQIGLEEFEQNIVGSENNFDSKGYFSKMVERIKESV